ncbi:MULTISPECIES: phosphoribosylformylglycinamidine cyclo-ligase [Bacillaceae]|uniref:phosphoribosylformylglycinamidine cyclo-ligase n=1 Tax=Bacillaceae TaxID=186817 RepID=UPI00062271F6|nr:MULTISPECIES: phosphoribosylformylglycinamidine cyclo-ligase [Bacillaceae]KKE78891.1 phosphoribosylaminoimidazole synthetase [Bacilli bacterium VT-13-104]PZD84422.1 phosphoribosylformylglycinamidine cyclo-ligase [Bacilli bacterium]MBU8791462.1 phosphoribosylformylglycinamidine cyclo-ligase [Oceanobacillus caeni]MED4473452.1 phosphoribosylformylglycinamidine cyclo-ligase [Oceanobacillus caeni]PZD89333.1 phosphoribosylformylglycinamidine cyclo-ligase [Bacilli bacterium]
MSDVYKQAGVDVEKGYEAVERMKKHIAKTTRPEVLGGIGSFAGLFDLSNVNYQEPVMVSGTDGVGTKLKLAFQLNKHDSVGIDLVAMCVNDIVAQGAQPLFFLDYIACGKNDPERMEQIVAGVSNGCVDAGAALIGGETAEMPGMYRDEEYDLAGFVVGIAEKSKLITGEAIQKGDAIIGLASSGIHSNGYSLVRKLVEGLNLNETPKGLSKSLGETLLTPTKIYAKSIARVLDKHEIKGISHITGGGFYENFPRMMPKGLGVEIAPDSWDVPEVFPFLQTLGSIPDAEMYGVFNMGIGMALVVSQDKVEEVLSILQEHGEKASVIGKAVAKEGVHFQS